MQALIGWVVGWPGRVCLDIVSTDAGTWNSQASPGWPGCSPVATVRQRMQLEPKKVGGKIQGGPSGQRGTSSPGIRMQTDR